MDARECAIEMLTCKWDRTKYLNPDEIGKLEKAIHSQNEWKVQSTIHRLRYLSDVRNNGANANNAFERAGVRFLIETLYPVFKVYTIISYALKMCVR